MVTIYIKKLMDGRWERYFRYRLPDGTYKYKPLYRKIYRGAKERTGEMIVLSRTVSSSDGSKDSLPECAAVSALFGTSAEQWLAYVLETESIRLT